MKLIDPGLKEQYVRNGWWENRTFPDLAAETINKHAGREAVVDGERRFTFAQLDRMADNLAGNLKRFGAAPGATISVQLPNCFQVFVAHLAIARIGSVFNPIIPIYRDREIGFILGREHTAIAIIPGVYRDFDYIQMLQRLRPNLPGLKHVLVWGAPPTGDTMFSDLDEAIGTAPIAPFHCEAIDPDDIRAVIYTSGTTGEPKGVQHSHNNLLAMERDLQAVKKIGPEDVFLSPTPLCHQIGLNFGLDAVFTLGCKAVLQDRWNPEVAVRLIEKERCTFTVIVPTMLQAILDCPAARQHDLSSVRWCGCGGAAVAPQLIERAWDELGWVRADRCYGMSEAPNITNGVAVDASLAEVRDRGASTDGKISGHFEAKVVDGDRKMLAPGSEGELAVRGPIRCLGYTNPKLNADCFDAGGWYYTGDVGVIDGDGYWTVTGRVKDVIVRGGEKISAKDVEDVLMMHPRILEAACVAMPDRVMGEKVCAYVKLRQSDAGVPLGLAEVNEFLLSQGLSKQKLPERLEVVKDFPRSSIGKISKVELRKDVAQKLGLPPVRA